MDIKSEGLSIIDEVLSLGGRAAGFDLETPLRVTVPELDSIAVGGSLVGFVDGELA